MNLFKLVDKMHDKLLYSHYLHCTLIGVDGQASLRLFIAPEIRQEKISYISRKPQHIPNSAQML